MIVDSDRIIANLDEFRNAMLKSAEAHSAMHPATQIDMNAFHNSCIGCLIAIKQLRTAQDATVLDDVWETIREFEQVVNLLEPHVTKVDARYWNDAPIVKCLTKLMNKGDTILREIKKQCNSQMVSLFDEDWMKETNKKYGDDLRVVLNDLSPCSRSAMSLQDKIDASAQSRLNADRANSAKENNISANSSNETQLKPAIKATDNSNAAPVTSIANAQLSAAEADKNKSKPERHISFLPVHEKDPNMPPFEKPIFKAHNYINLPQFTGIPAPTMPIHQKETPPFHVKPAAENVYVAPLHN